MDPPVAVEVDALSAVIEIVQTTGLVGALVIAVWAFLQRKVVTIGEYNEVVRQRDEAEERADRTELALFTALNVGAEIISARRGDGR